MNKEVSYHEEPKTTSVRNQYIAATIVSLGEFCYGIGIGWVSPSQSYLQSEECRYGEPLTQKQIGSVASLYCVGGVIGTFLFGWMAERIGRRRTGLIVSIPFIISWILKLTVTTYEGLLVARVFNGLGGGGGFLISPMYSLEIGSLRVRGALGSIAPLALNAGILFIYSIGAVLHYNVVLWINLSIPIIYAVAFYFMPETPSMLVKMNKIDEAAKSIAWLRNSTINDPNVQSVLANVQMENDLASKENVKKMSSDDKPLGHQVIEGGTTVPVVEQNVSVFKLFIKSKATRMAFIMGFILILVNGFVGVFAMINFASNIFQEAGSSLSPNISAIIFSVLQLAGSYLSIITIERLGRKTLFVISTSVFGLCLLVLGTYFYLKNSGYDLSSFGWIPILALSIGIFIDATGLGPVPIVIMNEIFMIQVREIAVTILMTTVWITEFVQTEFYAPAVDLIGISGVFWFFSSVAFFGSIFSILFVPETKGKPLDEILQYFDRRLRQQTSV